MSTRIGGHVRTWAVIVALGLPVAVYGRATPCPSADYAIGAPDALRLGQVIGRVPATVTLGRQLTFGACQATAVVKAKATATLLKAHWATCGNARKVRLSVRIDRPACAVAHATVRARHQPALPFVLTRIASSTTSTTIPRVTTTTVCGSGGGACGTGGPCPCPVCIPGTGASSTAVIGAAGGTLSFEHVTLSFLPGALAEDTPITVTSRTDCPTDGLDALTPLYEFGPEGLTFPQPVQLQLAIDPAAGPGVLRWSAPASGWETPGFISAPGVVSGAVTHFSDGYVGWFGSGRFNFEVDPTRIDSGDQVLLVFSVQDRGPTSCQIDQGVGPVALVDLGGGLFFGKATAAPTATTTYTLTCTGATAFSTSETVTVRPTPAATLRVSPSTIALGGTAQLTWSYPSGWSAYFDSTPFSSTTPQAERGTSAQVQPFKTTTYELVVYSGKTYSDFQEESKRVTLTVRCNNLGQDCSLAPCCSSERCQQSKCCMPLGQSCVAAADCCAGTTCGSAFKCCGESGGSCAVSADCCKGSCQNGTCCSAQGESCTFDTDCCGAGSTCVGGHCQGPCQGLGESCSGADSCCPGMACVHAPSGTSQACCVLPQGSGCNRNADCCASDDGVAVSCDPRGLCCNAPQASCGRDNDCCSGASCHSGACCSALTQVCSADADCCPGTQCKYNVFHEPPAKQCCLAGGQPCSSTDECCKLTGNVNVYCDNGTCCNDLNGSCEVDSDCCGGNTCQTYRCEPPVCLTLGEQPCSSDGGSPCCAGLACPAGAVACCLPQGASGCHDPSNCCLQQTDHNISVTCDGLPGPGTCCQRQGAQCSSAAECCSGRPCTKWGGASVGNCCFDYGAACQNDNDCCDSTYGGCAAPLNSDHKLCCRYDGDVCGGGVVPGNEQCCSGLCNNGQCCTPAGGVCSGGPTPSQCCPGTHCSSNTSAPGTCLKK